MRVLFGDIQFGVDPLVGPTAHTGSMQNTWAEHGPTRGKPVLQEIGSELETRSFDFFFSEEFCEPEAEFLRLKAAFRSKSPLPLLIPGQLFSGLRFVIDTLDYAVKKTTRNGTIVRLDSNITFLESPLTSLLGQLQSVARARAPALSGRAGTNPTVRR